MLFIVRDNAGPVCVIRPTQSMRGSLKHVIRALARSPTLYKKVTLYYHGGGRLIHVYVTSLSYTTPKPTNILHVEARAFNLLADVAHGVNPVIPEVSRSVAITESIDWIIPFVAAEYTTIQTDSAANGGSITHMHAKATTLTDFEAKTYLDFNKWVDATVRLVTNDATQVPEIEYEAWRGLLNDRMRLYTKNRDKWAIHQVDWGDIGEAGIDSAQVVWAPDGRYGTIYTRILEHTTKKPRKR